jgi:alpha-beta hydrolase superfamily lysophospholipase
MNLNKKKIFRWVKRLIIIYCLLGIALYYLQDYILFHPKKLDDNYVFKFDQPFEEVNIPVNKTDTINLVKFFPKDSIRRGVVLYYHGNMKNINRYASYMKNFTKWGYEVWIEDYPGFGKSTGERTEEKLLYQGLQIQKLAAAKYSTDSIIIYGKSLGTGIAAYVASETKCKQLILETPYYSIPDIFSCHGGFIFPLNKMIKYKIPTWQFLENVTVPITIFHGTNDWVIPYGCSKKLAAYLKPRDEFITIPGGNHNNLNDKELFHQKLDSLLR